MTWLIAVILIGLIPAAIAKSKGRDFVLWWVYGSLLFIVALPHALIMRADRAGLERRRVEEEGLRKCPFCAELVKSEAAVCRYCQRELPSSPLPPVATDDTDRGPTGPLLERDDRRSLAILVGASVIVLGVVYVLFIAGR